MKRVKILFRRTGLLAAALALAVQAFAVVAPASAASGTATWTGAAGDHKFSTAGNWAGNMLPVAGNTLVFNTVPAGGDEETIDNDISAVFGGLTMSTTTESGRLFLLTNDLSLEAGAIVTRTAEGARVGFAGDAGIVGQGALTVLDTTAPNIKSMAGMLTVNDSYFFGNIPSGATSLVLENDSIWQCITPNTTVATPITLGGNGGPGTIGAGGCVGGGGGSSDPVLTYTFSNVTLQANSTVSVYGNDIVNITNLTKNGYTLTREQDADGTLNTPDGTQSTVYAEKTTQLDGDTADNITVVPKETAYLNGKRASVYVRSEGILKGNGTTEYLNIDGTVAPGNSPGKITVVNNFSLNANGTYQAEILNKDSYDQIVAGAVLLGGKLEVTFLPGGSITQGDTFTIINNTGPDLVDGTFAGLAQGAQITVGGATFSINYNGGDGNDVVLTAINTVKAPGVPNTGFFAPTLANPAVIALLGLGSLVALLVVRKQVRR